MSRPVLLLLFVATVVSGCLGSTAEEGAAALDGRVGGDDAPAGPSRVMLVEYGVTASLLMDWPSPAQDVLCDGDTPLVGNPSKQYALAKLPERWVHENHTRLEFTVDIGDAFAEAGLTGYRFGAFYDDEPVFWTEPMTESGSFEHELDGDRYDVDGGAQWTFFFKRVDAAETDEDACSSGFGSGGFGIRIHAG